MSLLRYGAEEARNIAKAEKRAKQSAALDAFLAKRKATTDVDALALQLSNFQTSTNLALAGKEPTIAAGTTGQFWRGDKSWQAIAINDVTGLSSSLSGLSAAAAGKLSIPAIQAISTDAAATVSPSVTNTIVLHTGTLTANRAVTLSTSGITTGSIIRVVRTGTGAFSLTIGGLKALATNTWCDVVFNGTAWQLIAYGTL